MLAWITSVKQRKNIFQVRYCVLSQMNWNVFFLRFVSNRIVDSREHDYRWSRFAENRLQIRDLRIEIRILTNFYRISSILH
jgi:hypothetical protein